MSTCPTCGHDPEPVDLGRCPTCRAWPLYVGYWVDRHDRTVRCRGCLRIPAECECR